jgi:AAA15 family ATPase/GTPase
MLISFKVTNYKSLRDHQELSMLPSKASEDFDALPVAAIYGANAAGKSNLIEALLLLKAISRPQFNPREFKPSDPFRLDTFSRLRSTSFEFEADIDGVRYEYGLVAGRSAIEHESLYAFPKGRRRLLLERDAGKVRFGDSVPNKTTLNALFEALSPIEPALTLAESFKAEELQPFRDWLRGGITTMPMGASVSREPLARTFERHPVLTELAKVADLGIDEIYLYEVPGPGIEDLEDEQARVRSLQAAIDSTPDFTEAEELAIELNRVKARIQYLIEPKTELRFRHNGAQTSFAVRDESDGTIRFLRYLGGMLDILDRGATLVVDEFDTSLHSRLVPRIIELFKDPRTNPRNAQLIFTTHDATLLGTSFGEPILSRDEVWFVEKGPDGASHLFPLTAFKPRKEHNLERGYLGGSYGAVPEVFPDSLVEVLAAAKERSRSLGQEEGDPAG